MVRLRGLALEQRQAVLAEWDARCDSGAVHNAIAYLYGLIKNFRPSIPHRPDASGPVRRAVS